MRSNTPNRSSNPRKSAALALLTALLCACSAEDQNTGQSTIELPLPSVIRQVAALEGADLFLEIIINNNEPFINNSNQGTSNAWRVSIDVPVSQRNTITIRWIEMIEQKPVVLAQQIKSFDTGTSSSVVNLDDNYQTSGKGFDHDSDGISNLTERQNSTNPLVADSGQFVVNEPITVNISGGAYRIGSPASEAGRDASETQRDVFVEDFSLGKYEVTFEEYDQFATVTNRSKPDTAGVADQCRS